MSEPLLSVDKLEVVYQRAITAVQGITLSAQQGQIVGMQDAGPIGESAHLTQLIFPATPVR